MVDKPPRPILHLKFPPPATDTPRQAPETSRSLAPTTRVFTPPPKPVSPFKPFGGGRAFGQPKRAPPPKPAPEWRCKPCGAGFEVGRDLMDDEAVRCPSCNARLGLAADFRADPPNLAKVRARAVGRG